MFLAHGDTPLHDDPTFWHFVLSLGGAGSASFIWYWLTH